MLINLGVNFGVAKLTGFFVVDLGGKGGAALCHQEHGLWVPLNLLVKQYILDMYILMRKYWLHPFAVTFGGLDFPENQNSSARSNKKHF